MHFGMQVALSDSLVGSCCLTLTQYLHMNQEVVRLHLNGRNRIFIKWTPKIIHSARLCSLSQSLGCFLYLKAQWMERWGLPLSTNKAIILKSGNCKYLMTDSRLHVAEELLVEHFVSRRYFFVDGGIVVACNLVIINSNLPLTTTPSSIFFGVVPGSTAQIVHLHNLTNWGQLLKAWSAVNSTG